MIRFLAHEPRDRARRRLPRLRRPSRSASRSAATSRNSPRTKPAPLVDRASRQYPDRRRHRDADLVVAGRQPGALWRDLSGRAQPRLGGSAAGLRRAGQAPPAGTDDVAFIAKLIEKYVADGIRGSKRVYITGLSNGGAMTMTLVCARADLFAAAASVIMNLTDESASGCHPFAAGADAGHERHRRSPDPLSRAARAPAATPWTASGRRQTRWRSGGASMAARRRMPPSPSSPIAILPTKAR